MSLDRMTRGCITHVLSVTFRREPRTIMIQVDSRAIREAHARIAPWVRRTPLLAVDDPAFAGARVTFKLELLQHAGSFKTRGAMNNLLSRQIPQAGVTAASGGNHGVAVALAAKRLGLRAKIFVPEVASAVKVGAILAHGADVVINGSRYDDAQAACNAYAHASGALLVHPFDAEATLNGQGTIALEWHEDGERHGMPPIDTLLVAVGGGGLIAGIAAYWAGQVKVVGVEPEGSRCLHAALATGRPVDVEVNSVAQDSLGARRVGEQVFAIVKEQVDHVELVTDDEIRASQRFLWKQLRIASEPGGATALAAMLSGRYRAADGEHVGVLLCGGNVDPSTLG
jgi:threonine dehydratase